VQTLYKLTYSHLNSISTCWKSLAVAELVSCTKVLIWATEELSLLSTVSHLLKNLYKNYTVENRQPSWIDTFKDTVENLRINLKHSTRLVRYYRAEIDTQFDLLMLITEYTPLETLRQFIDQYGFLDEPTAGKSTIFLMKM
jgi:hypothetical protein